VSTCAAANGRNPNFMLVDVSVSYIYDPTADIHVDSSSMSTATEASSRLLQMRMV
jgi:hypothetical protein